MKVLIVQLKVQCGQIYYLVIVIVDVGDGIFDFGIFLEVNSFWLNILVDVDYEFFYDVFYDGKIMVEGCVDVIVYVICLIFNVLQLIIILIVVMGIVILGIDYVLMIFFFIMFVVG